MHVVVCIWDGNTIHILNTSIEICSQDVRVLYSEAYSSDFNRFSDLLLQNDVRRTLSYWNAHLMTLKIEV